MKVDGKKIFFKNGYTKDIIEACRISFIQNHESCAELALELQGDTIRETCYNIFQLLLLDITYKEDPKGEQLIKTPARFLWDSEGDCKGYSLFMASCLCCLDIPCVLRFVSYDNTKEYTHVYVVAYDENGNEIKIDPVAYIQAGLEFDNELEFTKKLDMNTTRISFVSGIGSGYNYSATSKAQAASSYYYGYGGKPNIYGDLTIDGQTLQFSETITNTDKCNINFLASAINYLEALSLVGIGDVTANVNLINLYKIAKTICGLYNDETNMTTSGYVLAKYQLDGAFDVKFSTANEIDAYYSGLRRQIITEISKYTKNSAEKEKFILSTDFEKLSASFIKWWSNKIIAFNYVDSRSANNTTVATNLWKSALFFMYSVVPDASLLTKVAKDKAAFQLGFLTEYISQCGLNLDTAKNIILTSIIQKTNSDANVLVNQLFIDRPSIGAVDWDKIFGYVNTAADSFSTVWNSVTTGDKGNTTTVVVPYAPAQSDSTASKTNNWLLIGGVALLGVLLLTNNKKKGRK
jgi:hypothetical protein